MIHRCVCVSILVLSLAFVAASCASKHPDDTPATRSAVPGFVEGRVLAFDVELNLIMVELPADAMLQAPCEGVLLRDGEPIARLGIDRVESTSAFGWIRPLESDRPLLLPTITLTDTAWLPLEPGYAHHEFTAATRPH